MARYVEGDKVRIRKTGLVCTVVDVRPSAGQQTAYTVESDTQNAAGGYGGIWPLFDCAEDELESAE